MFTGLVEEAGEVVSLARSRLVVRAREIGPRTGMGDSVAVNGCCLTVVAQNGAELGFDLLGETLARTNLGALRPGSLVNLERALAADGRLGGHFVQGHIDCTSEVIRFEQKGADHRIEIALPDEFAKYAAYKGSIAVNGISLTVAEVRSGSFVIWIIPHTMAVTNLRTVKAGDAVNLEFDLLAKYVERLITL